MSHSVVVTVIAVAVDNPLEWWRSANSAHVSFRTSWQATDLRFVLLRTHRIKAYTPCFPERRVDCETWDLTLPWCSAALDSNWRKVKQLLFPVSGHSSTFLCLSYNFLYIFMEPFKVFVAVLNKTKMFPWNWKATWNENNASNFYPGWNKLFPFDYLNWKLFDQDEHIWTMNFVRKRVWF